MKLTTKAATISLFAFAAVVGTSSDSVADCRMGTTEVRIVNPGLSGSIGILGTVYGGADDGVCIDE